MFMSWSLPPTNSQPSLSNQPVDSLSSLPQVVINTRPIERAAPLTRHLQAAGLTVVDMPMLSLQPRTITDKDMALMRQWLAGYYKALVIVSPTAAASGLAIWQALEHERSAQQDSIAKSNKKQKEVVGHLGSRYERLDAPSHLIAVGEATAAVLQTTKLQAAKNYQVLQPVIANNEGMLAMPEIESLQAGDKLLVWRGLGGRRLLVDTLHARGVRIDSIAWYERTMPTDASAQYQQWLQGFSTQQIAPSITLLPQPKSPKPIVIISSGTAFEHWTSIVNHQISVISMDLDSEPDSSLDTDLEKAAAPTLSDFAYVVLGVRLADMLAEQQLHYWQVEDLAPETILAAIRHLDVKHLKV